MRNNTMMIPEAPRLKYLFHPDSDKPRYTANPAMGISDNGMIQPAGTLIRKGSGCPFPDIAAPPMKESRHRQKIPIHVQESGRNMSYSQAFL